MEKIACMKAIVEKLETWSNAFWKAPKQERRTRQIVFPGLKITVVTGEDPNAYEGFSMEQMENRLAALSMQLTILRGEAPVEADWEEYDRWEEAVDDLEDQIDALRDAIEDRRRTARQSYSTMPRSLNPYLTLL
jgi:hypothetical protein